MYSQRCSQYDDPEGNELYESSIYESGPSDGCGRPNLDSKAGLAASSHLMSFTPYEAPPASSFSLSAAASIVIDAVESMPAPQPSRGAREYTARAECSRHVDDELLVQLMQQRRSSKQGRDVLSPPSSSSTSLGYARGYTSPAAGQRQDALGYSGIAVGIQSSLAQSEEEYVSLLRDEGATGARLSCSGALSNVRRSLQSQHSQPMSGSGDRYGCGTGRDRDRDPEKCYQTLTHPMPHGLSMSRTTQAKHRSLFSESVKARKEDQASRIKMSRRAREKVDRDEEMREEASCFMQEMLFTALGGGV